MKSSDPYLRTLRRLHRAMAEASARLAQVRALADTLPAPYDLGPLEAQATATREAFDAHAAQHPELAAELLDRAELADVEAEARQLARTLEQLRTAIVPVVLPPEPAPGREALDAAARAASAADAAYRDAAEAGANWHQIGRLEDAARKLGRKLARAEAAQLAAEARHRAQLERYAAAQARSRRHAADIALTMQALERLNTRAAELRAHLPAIPAAPLREPRRPFRAPVASPELRALIRERYRYEPATGTLHKLPHGELVRASQSVNVAGRRIPRAAVVAVLAPPPALDLESLDPESLA